MVTRGLAVVRIRTLPMVKLSRFIYLTERIGVQPEALLVLMNQSLAFTFIMVLHA